MANVSADIPRGKVKKEKKENNFFSKIFKFEEDPLNPYVANRMAKEILAQRQAPKTNITGGYSFDPGNVTTQKTPSTVSGASVGMMTGGLSPYAIGTGLIPGTTQTSGQIGTPTTKMTQTQGTGTQGVATQQPAAQPPLDLANEEKYLRGILKNEKADPALKNWAVQQAKQYGIDITQPTLEDLREQAKTAQQQFIEATRQGEISQIEAQRQRALGTLEQQRGLISPQYEALRTQAATRAMQQARNFAEYMGARGALTGGAATQAEIQRGAELQGQFGQLALAEQQAIQDIENRKSELQLDFENQISQANTQAEADKAAFDLNQKLEEISRIQNEQIAKIEAASRKSESDIEFQREKDLITFETNERIRYQKTVDDLIKERESLAPAEKPVIDSRESQITKIRILDELGELLKDPDVVSEQFKSLDPPITSMADFAAFITDVYGPELTDKDLKEILDTFNSGAFPLIISTALNQ